MKNIFEKRKNIFELEIEAIWAHMEGLDPDSKEYEYSLKALEKLYMMKKENSKKLGVTPDTMAVVFGNLIGIGAILYHEKLNVLSSKALGFVIRGRV